MLNGKLGTWSILLKQKVTKTSINGVSVSPVSLQKPADTVWSYYHAFHFSSQSCPVCSVNGPCIYMY